MTLREAQVSRKVVCTKGRYGVITVVGKSSVYVRYEGSSISEATDPRNITYTN
ncbi:hypothetical protein LIS04_147 [Listeria phage LIS04]|nr:hypothetical protein LIS04_147 [Listeria phage LIS04]